MLNSLFLEICSTQITKSQENIEFDLCIETHEDSDLSQNKQPKVISKDNTTDIQNREDKGTDDKIK